MLKMVYCYLGLGLFCKSIPNVKVSNAGLKTAKKLVDFIEQPSVWEEMEFRRKILYHIAKAEFCRRERKIEIARCDAGEAQRIANKSDWRTELPNISLL